MLVRSSADELGSYGVRVNAVRPGLVPTDMTSALTNHGPTRQDYVDQMPMGRVGTPNDIGEAVRFLAGPESSWITGVALDVDGGQHLRRGADLDGLLEPMFHRPLQAVLGERRASGESS
jgi:NAD(P)-dependent dehydrogenase (short-subunit alcohol dehydrogenase family)